MAVPILVWAFGALFLSSCLSRKKESAERERCGECHQNPEHPMDGFLCLLGREDERCEDLKKFMDKHTIHSARITQPLLCEDCHTIYQRVTDPLHIDDQAGADIRFPENGRAAQREVQPFYNPETKTCEVACHGLNLLGGAEHSPPWDQIQKEEEGCKDVCHALPPPYPHIQNITLQDCHRCHETVAEDGTIAKTEFHINGRIDLREGDICTFCHGQPPPPSPLGNNTERRDSVGVHQTHLVTQPLSTNVMCDHCHVIPKEVGDPSHNDGDGRAEIIFGGLAVAGQVKPVYNHDQKTCTQVYCHGATRSGGALTTPSWSDESGEATQCHSCHGTPPLPPHIQNLEIEDCHLCHTKTDLEEGGIARRDLHVNGTVDVIEDICVVCHGQPPTAPEFPNHPNREDCWTCHPDVQAGAPGERPAIIDHTQHNNGTVDLRPPPEICTACHGQPPPPSPLGTNDERQDFIGAHQTHLVEQPLSTNVTCNNCHLVPEAVLDPTHRDGDDQAEVLFSGLAMADDVTAIYNPSELSCSVYCHGASLSGGLLNEPVWNDFSGNPIECSSCHGAPPPPPHFPNLSLTDCHRCHTETVGAEGTIVNRAFHVNGTLDVIEDICVACHGQPPAAPEFPNHPNREDCWTCHPTVGPGAPGERPVILDLSAHNNGEINFFPTPQICTACHGSEENGPAPPPDTEGNMERTARAVGAHQEHLTTNLTTHVVCDSCHNVPQQVLTEGHRNGIRDVVFAGGMGTANGVSATYNPTTQSCQVYCHGLTFPSGALTQPVWTDISGEPAQCNSCHGFPPTATGSHTPEDTDCYNCHFSVNQLPNGTWIITEPELHLNGVVDQD